MAAPVLDTMTPSNSTPQDNETVDVSMSGHDADARTIRLRGAAIDVAQGERSNHLYTDISVGVALAYECVQVDLITNEPLATPDVTIVRDASNPALYRVTV